MNLTMNSDQIENAIVTCMLAGRPCMITGDPGSGKSDIIKQIAKRFKLFVYDVRLSQMDPTDMNGFPHIETVEYSIPDPDFIPDKKDPDKKAPMITKTKQQATYIPMDTFPLEHTPIPKGYKGFLLLLDEMNSGSISVQAASYKVLLDKIVGQTPLHPNTAIIGAGNLVTNKAIVNRLSTAMQSRLVHMQLRVDHKTWLSWAVKNNVSTWITSYINHRPDKLHMFDPNHDDSTFACPRTWFFASELMAKMTGTLRDNQTLLAGAIGRPAAFDFVAYTSIYSNLPTIDKIEADPLHIKFSKDPAVAFALSHMVGAYMDAANMDQLMKFVLRLDKEFQVLTMQCAIVRGVDLIDHPACDNWITVNGSSFTF